MNWPDPVNWHFSASVFPLMPPDELEDLAADIKTNGLLNPVIRCDRKIVDGRNRVIACSAIGVEPRFRDISKEQANVWAVSQNIFRRTIRPEEETFALKVLSNGSDTVILGRKRLKARHKLKKLREELFGLIERAKVGEDVLPELEELLRRKKSVITCSLFRSLIDNLHRLRTSHSDGVEHKFITQMEQAINQKSETDTDKYERKVLIQILTELSRNFLEYAEKLKMGLTLLTLCDTVTFDRKADADAQDSI